MAIGMIHLKLLIKENKMDPKCIPIIIFIGLLVVIIIKVEDIKDKAKHKKLMEERWKCFG